MATLLWINGFEHGNVTTGVAGTLDAINSTPTISTSTARSGLRSLQLNPSVSTEYVQINISATIVTQAFYVRYATLPSGDFRIADFANATSGNGRLTFQSSSGQLAVSIGGGALAAGGPVLSANTWYRVVIEYDTSTSTGSIKCRVDNGTEFSTTAAITSGSSSSCRLGTDGGSSSFDAFLDDWIISVTDGDYEEISGTWTGHAIESLIPSADGTHNITTSGDFDSFVGTAFSNSTTNGNTFIGHRPLQLANTADQVIRQDLGATTNYMEFTLENHTLTGTPRGARGYGAHIEASTTNASLGEMRLLLSDDTEVLTTGSLSVINSTEDPGTTLNLRKRMCIDPSGGWDNTKVDGLKIRVGFGDGVPDVNFIDAMIEVLYAEEPAAPYPLVIVPDMAIYAGPSDA